jgi:hypothetical protein
MTEIELINGIYIKLYVFLKMNEINVFLCGKDTADVTSIRSKLKKGLDHYSNVNIVFPEWLFHNLLNQGKSDLITLENALAIDVDKIILPLEGPGALCEFGAFVMNEKIAKKLIVLNKKEYEHRKTFINDGPIRLMKKNDWGHVFYYDLENIDEIIKSIENKIIFGKYSRKDREIFNLFSFSSFVGVLIGIFQPISRKYMEKLLKKWNSKIDQSLFDPALESLIEREFITINTTEDDEIIKLTKSGNEYYYSGLMSKVKMQRIYTNMRSNAIWAKHKNGSKFNVRRGKAKLLD